MTIHMNTGFWDRPAYDGPITDLNEMDQSILDEAEELCAYFSRSTTKAKVHSDRAIDMANSLHDVTLRRKAGAKIAHHFGHVVPGLLKRVRRLFSLSHH